MMKLSWLTIFHNFFSYLSILYSKLSSYANSKSFDDEEDSKLRSFQTTHPFSFFPNSFLSFAELNNSWHSSRFMTPKKNLKMLYSVDCRERKKGQGLVCIILRVFRPPENIPFLWVLVTVKKSSKRVLHVESLWLNTDIFVVGPHLTNGYCYHSRSFFL